MGRYGQQEDPTPEEIRERCLKIQAGWSDREKAKRRITKTNPWLPEEVQVNHVPQPREYGYEEHSEEA